MLKKVVLIVLIIVIGLVFYYSWVPNPDLRNETYLPKWILSWSNHHSNLRTAIPFIALGFLLEIFTIQKSLYPLDQNKYLSFMRNVGIAAGIACVAEGGQFLIQNRSPDIMDVYYGIIGSIIGGVGSHLFCKLMDFNNICNAK